MQHPDGGPISNSAKALMDKGIYDLFPFKIVPLSWLYSIGKYIVPPGKGYQRTDKGVFYFGLMTFDPNDNYLPLGDVFFKEGTDISKTWVVLIKNDPNFSTIIPENNWSYVSRSRGCNGTEVYWTTRAVNVQNRIIKHINNFYISK